VPEVHAKNGEQWTIGQVSIIRLCTKHVLFLMLLDLDGGVPFPSSTPAKGFGYPSLERCTTFSDKMVKVGLEISTDTQPMQK
jgi:hypothetical protein